MCHSQIWYPSYLHKVFHLYLFHLDITSSITNLHLKTDTLLRKHIWPGPWTGQKALDLDVKCLTLTKLTSFKTWYKLINIRRNLTLIWNNMTLTWCICGYQKCLNNKKCLNICLSAGSCLSVEYMKPVGVGFQEGQLSRISEILSQTIHHHLT